MLRIKNEYLVVVILGLLCTFMYGKYLGFLVGLNFVVALICAAFFLKKEYVFILLLALNFALYFNAIDAPFEQPELWTYHVSALANATYGISVLVYASAFLGFLTLVAYAYFFIFTLYCALRSA
ncbi:transporter [Campylobacter concisus]|uniref:transporter n=1 Tax=Campylobacter concisus TaxID=199 RepID=UPI001E322091|nr:transporter [Campylobacter concisus]